jgi:hypothetical protein
MKIIGTLDSRNDGDLLQQVLDQPEMRTLDAIYAYDDGSTDNTRDILFKHPSITKYASRFDFSYEELSSVPQHRRHWLLQTVRDTYPNETVWVVRLEGDRFFLNQPPVQTVQAAISAGQDYRCGVMIDFRRSMAEGWGAADTWPSWDKPIQQIQTYARIDDIHRAVVFKVTDELKYDRQRPWPSGLQKGDYIDDKTINKQMAFFAHHGRRGPKAWCFSYTSGSRKRSSKFPASWDFTSPERAETTVGFPFQTKNLVKWESFYKSYDALETMLYHTVHEQY